MYTYGSPDLDALRRKQPWLRPLLILAVVVTAASLMGILVLPEELPGEDISREQPIRGVSRLEYPASLISTIAQPAGGQWVLPASSVEVGGVLFVLDTGGNRILELDQTGRLTGTLDGESFPDLVLRQPMAMATDGRRLFIANSLAAEVLVVDPSGRVERSLALGPLIEGEEPPRPIGIAVSGNGTIVVSDADNHRVLLLDQDGRLLKAVGTGQRAAAADGFNVPAAVTVDAASTIYVVDTLNGRVVRLSPEGAYAGEFGSLGDTAGTFSRPKGVAVDAQGRVYVSDGLLAAVQVFGPDGRYLGVIGRRDPEDPAAGSIFQAPAGLWFSGDRLYVTDRLAGVITLQPGVMAPAQAAVEPTQ